MEILIKNSLLFVVLISAILFSCNEATENNTKKDPFEWSVSSISDEGIDSIKIDSIHKNIVSGDYGLVDHLLVIRNGNLIFDKHYENNYDSIAQLYDTANFQFNYNHPAWHPYYKGSDLHTLQSCTKSITSLLIGIAIDEGLITNTDIKVMELFDSYRPTEKDALKDSITLQDLLTMRGGFNWDESRIPYSDPNNNCYILETSDNWLEYILQVPMDTIPGTKFEYNSGITVLLGEIIRIKTGERVDKWAEEKLFKPLDITDYYWKISPNGEVDTEGGLYLSIYDFAKIGQLVLNKGSWQGKRIISEKWLQESTSQHVKPDMLDWYGYQWWLWNPKKDDYQLILAIGYGGQYLFIDPENNLLTVMNRWNIHGSSEKSPFTIPISVSESIIN
jgi:hypothetical protein